MNATTTVPINVFHGWLATGERGLSAEAIVTHLTGTNVSGRFHIGHAHHPSDPSDFRRCQLLLRAVPLAKLMFPAMRGASPQWARLVDAWDEIDATIEQEVPGYVDNARDGRAPLAYRLMKRVIAGGTFCVDCGGSGNGTPCEKCKGSGRRGGGRCRAKGCYSGHALCTTCRGNGYTGGDR